MKNTRGSEVAQGRSLLDCQALEDAGPVALRPVGSSHLRSRSSASSVGFCCAFSGVGCEACSCSSRSLWISCKISLGREEEGKKPGSVSAQRTKDLTSGQSSSGPPAQRRGHATFLGSTPSTPYYPAVFRGAAGASGPGRVERFPLPLGSIQL